MNTDTITALRQLAEALMANPEDARQLLAYGDLPLHLADALVDWDLPWDRPEA